ncbi:OmpA family lipoprotein [Maricurvus nonylphenolicus]|uniref:OmpA family protein n=1 Tax=Maricurvus nonylphenolicus TaxID=1008307 RepID=UPI0036F3D9EA
MRIFSLLLVLVMVGCTTVDPYTGEQKTSSTAKGAGAGAVVGAIIGAATSSKGDRNKGILTGAVAGGAIGGGIGYYMDQQEAALRQKLAGSGVQVRREGDNLRLVMPGNITFDTGRYEIRSNFYNVLDSVAQVLGEFDKTAIKIAGHTDSTGSLQTNQVLSERRAESVKNYLLTHYISVGRIQTAGYGPRYPVASNDTAQGRQANRRVELELLPI